MVEGEKDVDRLRGLGLVATCNVGGCGMGWRDEYSDSLKGRNVIVLPDNDEPGQKHADAVAQSLQGKAATVRLLTLPGLPDKGDVTDWLSQGGNKDELLRLAHEAATSEPSASATDLGDGRSSKLCSAADLFDMPSPAWLVESVMPEDAEVVLFGKSGAGKSFVMLDMALCVVTGKPWLESFSVEQGPVVYIAAEGLRGLTRRAKAWTKHHGRTKDDLANWFWYKGALNLLDDYEVSAFVSEVSRMVGPSVALVVIDPLARCMAGGDENSTKDMGLAVASIDRILQGLGCTVAVVHHTGHNEERERGSSALRASQTQCGSAAGAARRSPLHAPR